MKRKELRRNTRELIFHDQKLMGLVVNIANQCRASASSSVDYDDLIAAGMRGLEEAHRRFNKQHSSKAKFSTYAYTRIWGTIQDFILNERKFENRHTEIVGDFPSPQVGIESTLARRQQIGHLHSIITRELPEPQVSIMRGLLQGKPERIIAEELGTTRTQVFNEKVLAMRYLKERLRNQ